MHYKHGLFFANSLWEIWVITTKSPVITVHHYKGRIENPDKKNSDTFDWAHPNPRGQKKMAVKWYESMKPYLKKIL